MRIAAKAGIVALGAALVAGCGSSSTPSASAPPGFSITIANLSFSPLNLAVPPGATITVVNADSMAHSVTSESSAGAFTPGSVAGISFDTGAFMGQKSFTIPSSAPDGTVIPYYCTVHLGTMSTPNGTITVNAAAQPPAAPAPGTPGY